MNFFLRFFFRTSFYGAGIWILFSFLKHYDIGKIVLSHAPGSCRYITGIEHGAEDLDVLPSGLVILSTGAQFFKHLASNSTPDPAMMTYDVTKPEEPAKALKLSGFKGTLNPHGISLSEENGKTYVYIINHAPYLDRSFDDKVEKFLWNTDKNELVFQKSFTDSEFIGINDLVVVAPNQFYVSNHQTSKNAFLGQLEMFAWFLPLQNIIYFDGAKGTVVLEGLYSANGVSVSPDKKYLYASEVQKRRVSSYRIKSPTDLVLIDRQDLGSMPDNINVEPETGDLWVGCHPSYLSLFRRFFVSTATSPPSQVLRIEVKNGKFGSVTDIFADDGQKLSTSSAAAYHKKSNTVFIGTVLERAMTCQCETCGISTDG